MRNNNIRKERGETDKQADRVRESEEGVGTTALVRKQKARVRGNAALFLHKFLFMHNCHVKEMFFSILTEIDFMTFAFVCAQMQFQ